MKFDEDFHYTKLVLLMDGLINCDPIIKKIVFSAEFKNTIAAEVQRIKQESLQSIGDNIEETVAEETPHPSDVMHLIIDGEASQGKSALKVLKRWLHGAEHVIFCDPYFLHGGPSPIFNKTDDYVKHVAGLVPKSTKIAKIFTTGYTAKVKQKIRHALKEGRELIFFDTNEIHDRYIIKDKTHGKLIGTSFGGFGNKIFTILDLPPADVKRLKAFLRIIETDGR